MKAMPLCIAALAALCAPGAAQVRYDVKLERAVMEIIARKIGDIRPTLHAEAPARRVVAGRAAAVPVSRAPAAGPADAPRDASEAWRELRGASDAPSVSAGSFQSFPGGAGGPPEHRAAAADPAPRLVDF